MNQTDDPEAAKPAAGTVELTDLRRTRDFYRVASISSALSFGILAATLQCLHRSAAGFSFTPSLVTIFAFIIGAGLSLLYWKLVLNNPKATRLASWLMAFGGIAMFLYPLRFIPADKLPDMSVGLVFAVIALSGVAGLLLMMRRFLSDDESNTSTENGQKESPDSKH